MPNNNTFFFYNNTHQNTTQETDHPSALKITLGIIGTIMGMIIVGAYFYSLCFEQNRVAPRQEGNLELDQRYRIGGGHRRFETGTTLSELPSLPALVSVTNNTLTIVDIDNHPPTP